MSNLSEPTQSAVYSLSSIRYLSSNTFEACVVNQVSKCTIGYRLDGSTATIIDPRFAYLKGLNGPSLAHAVEVFATDVQSFEDMKKDYWDNLTFDMETIINEGRSVYALRCIESIDPNSYVVTVVGHGGTIEQTYTEGQPAASLHRFTAFSFMPHQHGAAEAVVHFRDAAKAFKQASLQANP